MGITDESKYTSEQIAIINAVGQLVRNMEDLNKWLKSNHTDI